MSEGNLQETVFPAAVEAAPDLEFTGERIVPGKTPEAIFQEHEERYVFAGQYVSGKDVLDVACGTGVGTSFLRQVGARSVLGLDIDSKAIAFARARYKDCAFTQCEATDMCVPDSSVDVVVSFETLEHLKDQHKFLKECRRALRPGGLIICSTPNRTVYRWWRPNPYHVNEFTVEEFIDFVGIYFGEVSLFGQDEKIYPMHVLRRLAANTLDRLKLKAAIKDILGWKAPVGAASEQVFSKSGKVISRIRRLRASFSFQPTYIIGLGRKITGP
jgi:ubiquinone/menaquinone biosynthesis C-methylase UbiE